MPRLNTLLLVVVAVIGLGIVADGVVIVTHLQAARQSQSPSATTDETGGAKNGAHPCNHGFYVSQAAHAKKGGGYVKQVAQGDLGKNGNCSAPLPAPAPNTKPATGEADD
ncbi:MAG TPA: hypothetical protein VF956_09685 [Candidatus Dormibacteraeota bacterium]